jgi:hypothetical protein
MAALSAMYQFPESMEEIKLKFRSDILCGHSAGFFISGAVNRSAAAANGRRGLASTF